MSRMLDLSLCDFGSQNDDWLFYLKKKTLARIVLLFIVTSHADIEFVTGYCLVCKVSLWYEVAIIRKL